MKYLVLGPSALGVFAVAGCLNYYEKHSMTDDLLEIAGSSSGALLGFVWLMMNKDTQRVLNWALDIDTKSITELKLPNLLSEFGLIDHSEIKRMLPGKGGTITFRELYQQTNIKFHISAFCVNRSVTEYFSVDTTPSMKVVDALCMSISIPLLFKPYMHQGHHYVDGGTVEDVPTYPFMNRPPSDITCIKVDLPFIEKYTKVTNLKEYLTMFVLSIVNHRHTCVDVTHNTVLNIQLESDVNPIDFSMDNDTKLKLFLNGYHFAEARTHSGRTK